MSLNQTVGLIAGQLPQDPFLPQVTPRGPSFLDTGACLCALRTTPDPAESNAAWHCLGNQTQGVYTATTGKWFKSVRGGRRFNLSIDDASNGPDTKGPLLWDPETNDLVPFTPPGALSVFDRACTGENNTVFSAAFYRAVRDIASDRVPISAAPCWRPGAVPMQIQSVDSWVSQGCNEGFLCAAQSPGMMRGMLTKTRCEQHREFSSSVLSPFRSVPVGETSRSNMPLQRQKYRHGPL
jgi:hypothetical protein